MQALKRREKAFAVVLLVLVGLAVFAGPRRLLEVVRSARDAILDRTWAAERKKDRERAEHETNLQLRGVYAFGDADVQEALQLDDSQRDQIRGIINSYREFCSQLDKDPLNRYLAERRALLRLARTAAGEGDQEAPLPRFVIEEARERAWAWAAGQRKEHKIEALKTVPNVLSEAERARWKAMVGSLLDPDEREIWE
jgi:hypothetical protein